MTFYFPIGQELLNLLTDCCKLLKVNHCQNGQFHNANKPMQYTGIFHGCKNVNFRMKFFNTFIIFAQNIDCGFR